MEPSTAPEATERAPRTVWAWAVATFGGVGFLPLAPGSWASGATVLLWALAARYLPAESQWGVALGVTCVAIIAGIPAASIVERETGKHDAQIVVIDEVAGQMLALVLAPAHWKSLLAGFILFRVFDTLKPPPCRRLERAPEGAGIVLDDVGAGAYAFAVMQLLVYTRVI